MLVFIIKIILLVLVLGYNIYSSYKFGYEIGYRRGKIDANPPKKE